MRNFINLETVWLPNIHSQTSMVDQQNRTPLQSKAGGPNDKVSKSIPEISQGSVQNQQRENQDNESKPTSDKKSKKTEKPAALGKDLNFRCVRRKLNMN